MDTQLIAHDKEVYDIAWGGMGVFASVSADGSVRVFDLRCAAMHLIMIENVRWESRNFHSPGSMSCDHRSC